jgi:hypothetical protein
MLGSTGYTEVSPEVLEERSRQEDSVLVAGFHRKRLSLVTEPVSDRGLYPHSHRKLPYNTGI